MITSDSFQRILLAEDDEDDTFLFQQALLDLGLNYELHLANDGIQVLKMLNSRQDFDIVFLDINMPLKNGFQCLEEIPDILNSGHIPVVCLSTSNDKTIIKRARDLGASGYIIKSISYARYLEVIKEILLTGLKPDPKDGFLLFRDA